MLVLPQLEQQNLYDAFDTEVDYNTNANKATALKIPNGFYCPSGNMFDTADPAETSAGALIPTSHYVGCAGPVGNNPVNGNPYPGIDNGQGRISTAGVLYPNSETRLEHLADGATSTILVGEISWDKSQSYRNWTRGCTSNICGNVRSVQFTIEENDGSSRLNHASFGSQHPGGAMIVFCDGSTRFLPEVINLNTFRALASRKGKEVVGEY